LEVVGDPLATIDTRIAAFDNDKETALAESTIQELVSTYPNNQAVEHILLKVLAINALYHTRVLDIDLQPLANHIKTISELDLRLKAGTPDVVDAIWKSTRTRRHYFSFATKFCSWHNQEAYAIYDLNVWEALAAYRRKDERFTFRDAECETYSGFIAVVRRFQKAYDLDRYTLKSVDKFLWGVGGDLISERQRIPHEA
jgi:hypothetical protein